MARLAKIAWRPVVMAGLAVFIVSSPGASGGVNDGFLSGAPFSPPANTGQQLSLLQSPSDRESVLRIVNRSPDKPASVSVGYFDPTGNQAAAEPVRTLAAGTNPENATFIFVDRNPQLPAPFYGSGVLGADQPVGSLHIRHSVESGADTMAGNVGPDGSFSRLLIPMLFSRFPLRDLPSPLSSRINIFNPSVASRACVWISYADLANRVRLSDGMRPLADPVQCPYGGYPILPGGSLVRDLEEMASSLLAPYIGSALVVSAPNASGHVHPITADVEIWNGQQYGSYTVPGVTSSASPNTSDDVHKQVVLPLVFKEYGPWNSYLHIQSYSSWSGDIIVRLTFRGIEGDVFTTFASVSRNRSLDLRWIADFRLPSGFRGSVTIENITNNNVISAAVLNYYRSAVNHPFFTYEAAPSDAAVDKVIMALVYKNREGTTSSNGWNTRIAIQTTDGAADSLSLKLTPEQCCVLRTATVRTVSNGFQLVNVRGLLTSPALPDGFVGTAQLVGSAGRKSVALVILEDDAARGDLWMAYHPIHQ